MTELICKERLGHLGARQHAAVRKADGDNWWEDRDKCCMFPIVIDAHSADPDTDKLCLIFFD